MEKLEQYSETIFTLLLGVAFASLFFRHGVMHLVALIFIIALLVFRPRLPWIAPFWWMLLFIIWEWLSNFLGPYQGKGIENGGIGYHFLFMFIPLSLPVINKFTVIAGAAIGGSISALLIWVQSYTGVDINANALRIDWSTLKLESRPVGFNRRPWETQFIHSIVLLSVMPLLVWRKAHSWLLVLILLSGGVLPQIRAVLAAFLSAFSLQLFFITKSISRPDVFKKIFLFIALVIVSVSIMSFLRPNFTTSLAGGNGRDKIFAASFKVFEQYPHTGIGGGKNFKEHYQQAWKDLGWHKEGKTQFLEVRIGHPHSDALLLLAHHGWPSLLLWTAFIFHCLLFVWQYGVAHERTIFISLVVMHHIAGLAETYLDYSNTAYAIFLCYGLALHGPVQRWKNAIKER